VCTDPRRARDGSVEPYLAAALGKLAATFVALERIRWCSGSAYCRAVFALDGRQGRPRLTRAPRARRDLSLRATLRIRPRFGGLNRTLPANVPKFDQPHPETGFDRECVSSNPLTPASQSRCRRCHPSKRRKARYWRAFAIRRRSLDPQIGELAGRFGKSLRPLYRGYSRFGETRAGDEVRSHCVLELAV
jgi:hypothetical protein